jgi:HPt (histidine-containing phosphotransfer) domain-containing protein
MTDLKVLAEQLGLDMADFIELTQLFVDTTQKDIDRMEKSLQDNDAPLTQEVVHAIKGAAGNLGFTAIYTMTLVAEKKAAAGNLASLRSLPTALKRELEALRHAL